MPRPPRPLRILLVEDSADDAELLALELREAGLQHELLCVDDEQQMRDGLANFAPDVMVSDSNLPGFSGYRALELARQAAPQLPVVLCSGAADQDAVPTAPQADAVVFKHELEQLPAVIRRLLGLT